MAVGSNNDNGWPVADSTANVGGAAGTLGIGAGTNMLQESIDRLDTTLNSLVAKIADLPSGGSAQQAGSGRSGGIPTSFPPMFNPFSSNQAGPSTGIGGGGKGGAGNVSTIQSFGKTSAPLGIVNAFAGYGASRMGTQLGLNAYATQTALAMGQTSNNFTQQYKQAFGFNNQNLNALASSPMDALAGTQGLQYLSSSAMYNGNQLGRAGYGAAAAFGMANPSMSFQQQVGAAQNIYSPQVAMNMQLMGYGVTPRKMGGGANNLASVSQGMLRAWYGQKRVNQSTLVAGLGEGGKVNANLQALGINPSSFGSTLEEYNQLFNKGLNTNQAQSLINTAGKNSAAGRAAQQRLSSLGVKTATSSMQQLRNNQSAVTGRDADVASGFSDALATSTGLLNTFNTGLSSMMTKMGLNGAAGSAGGALGVMSGTSGANSLMGAGSSLGTMALAAKAMGIKIPGMPFAGGGNAVAEAAGASGGEGTAAAAAATTGSGAAGMGILGSAGGALGMGLGFFNDAKSVVGNIVASKGAGRKAESGIIDFLKFLGGGPGGAGMFPGGILQSLAGGLTGTPTAAGMGGGATSVATSAQSKPGSSTVQTGSVSGAAIKAVAEAKSQLGVPYVYGGMKPGVGFDCCLTSDALVQTVTGPISISEINSGDKVYTWNNGIVNTSTVIARKNEGKQKVYKISTNRRTVTASGNHPFNAVFTGINQQAYMKWTRLDELCRGQYIVVLDSIPDVSEKEVEDSYLWVLGAMFGDGHLSKKRGRINLCLYGDQREYAINLLDELTDSKIIRHESHGIYLSDVALYDRLSEDGMAQGQYSSIRKIPGWLWQLSHRQIELFLEGYTEADGSRSSTKSYSCLEYKAPNEILIHQVRNLFLVIGVNTSKVTISPRNKQIIIKGKEVKNALPLFCFESYPDSRRKALGYLGGRPSVAKLFPSENFMPEKIMSIEPAGEAETYDIEVKGAHNFIANGISVHNSGLVDWAYKQAGVQLPRTSGAQWTALSNRAVALNSVREGDLVFSGGADGTSSDPGHVGMMVSGNQLIQAPHTGANIQIIGYDPKAWSHAARPSGSGGGIIAGGAGTGSNGSSGTTGANQGGVMGNMGAALVAGNYGSSEEVDAVSAALSGSGGGNFYASAGSYGAAGSGSGSGGPGASTGGGTTKNLSGNKKIMNRWAAKFGWGTGGQWSALNTLEMHEAGYNNLAQNPTSTAFGMGQFLDTTWATVGGHKTSDPNLQSQYMMEYIKERYGSPEKAWGQYYQHKGGVGWYGTGGKTGQVSVVGDRGPEIMIGGSGNQILDANQTAAILKAASAQPAQSPHSVLSETQMMNGATQGSSGQVNLNFGQGSVVINMNGANGSATDTSKSGRAIAQSFTQWLQKEDVYDAISKGNKNG
jgi:cell wall-associated NlpC family hydrolase/intein/homing endonuclease